MKRRLFIAAMLLTALCPVLAEAAVTCTTSATAVAFGAFSPFGAAVNSTGTVKVTCSGSSSASYSITLSTGGAGSFSPRQMKSGVNLLSYNLYTDSGHSSIWGNGTGGTVTISDTMPNPGSGTTKNYTAYGRIPTPQASPSGSFTDTITVTITY